MTPRRTPPHRRWLALAAFACVALAAPAAANAASTVSYSGNSLSWLAEDAATDNTATITLNAAATTYTITDSELINTASAACTGTGTHTVTCTADTPGDDNVSAAGRGGGDHITIGTSAAPAASQPDNINVGGPGEIGNDVIDLSGYTNPEGSSQIEGGGGTDTEIAGLGSTEFYMGDAQDGTGDQLIGGPGYDTARYENRTNDVKLNAADGLANDGEAGENDNISPQVDGLESGAGNDTLVAGPVNSYLYGGQGNNTLTGGPGADQLEAQDGNDTMSGGDGPDELGGQGGNNNLKGGAGDDYLSAGEGTNAMDGGTGDDSLYVDDGTSDVHGGDGFDYVSVRAFNHAPPYQDFDVSVMLDDLANDGAAGRGANIHSDIEDVSTETGNDTVVGTDAPGTIYTDAGNDVVNPRGGSDFVFAYEGNDTINARDGVFDRISCGGGNDTAIVDDIDALSGCESVSSAPVPGAAAPRDRLRSKVALSRLAKSIKRRDFVKHGLTLRVAPNEPVSLMISLTGHTRGARITRAGDLVVATKTLAMSGSRRTVRLKPPRGLRFGRHFKLQLEIDAIDGGGNVTTVRRTIKVK
jgi:Ca2+-binding RTX toxin-like protein